MCRCNFIVATLLLIMFTMPAQAADAPVAKRKKTRSTISHTEIGLGYLAWNEDFKIHDATNNVDGVASYGGVGFYVEQSWFVRRWQLGANLAFASGKASANASGAITYSDGTNRAWSTVMLEPFARYLINNYILLGVGLLYRHVGITWDTADTTLTLDPKHTSITGQFDFKVRLSSRWNIAQSFAPLGFNGKSQWFTTIGYVF